MCLFFYYEEMNFDGCYYKVFGVVCVFKLVGWVWIWVGGCGRKCMLVFVVCFVDGFNMLYFLFEDVVECFVILCIECE